MSAVSTIVVRSAEQLVTVEQPSTAPRVAAVQVSPPRGLPGAEIELRVNDTHIQWRVVGAASWINLIALATLIGPTGATGAAGATGATGPAGADGAAPEFQVDGTMLQWRLVGAASWINLFDLETLGGGTDLVETVPAVAQVTEVNFSPVGLASNLFGNYIDIPFDLVGHLLRVWFDDDGAPAAPPATPADGRIVRVGLTGSETDADIASAFASAVQADPDLAAVSSGGLASITHPAGDLSNLINSTAAVITITTAGAAAYDRFLAVSGELLTDLNAENLQISAPQVVLGRSTAGEGMLPAELLSISALLNWISTTRGASLYRGLSGWQALIGNGLLRLNSDADPTIIDPSGMVVNTKYFEKKDTVVVTGTTFVSVFSGTITLKFPTSRVVMMSMLNCGQNSTQPVLIRAVRNGNAIVLGDAAGNRTRITAEHYTNQVAAVQTINLLASDQPGSGTHTYEIHIASSLSGSVFLGRSGTDSDLVNFPRAPATMILMEVLA